MPRSSSPGRLRTGRSPLPASPAPTDPAEPLDVARLHRALTRVLLDVVYDPEADVRARVQAVGTILEVMDRARHLELLAAVERSNADLGRRLEVLERETPRPAVGGLAK